MKLNVLRGYSLIGKTTILHIVILGSSPDFSIKEKKIEKKFIKYKLEKLNLVERNSEDV
jgi:hypothetical protein